MVNEQLSIFDYIESEHPDIHDINEEDMVEIIWREIGVSFTYDTRLGEWFTRIGKLKLTLEYSHYNLLDNHDLFISCGYSYRTSGGGRPCDTIREAVEWFKKKREEYNGRAD